MTPVELVSSLGYLGIWAIIFLESGLFMFFLPGDSLHLAAGILASQNVFDITVVLIGSTFFAFLGNTVGYIIGKKIGANIFKHPKSWFFNKARLQSAHNFYTKNGPLTIVLARFIPVVRTFVPIAAGAAGMSFKKFTIFNLLGAAMWAGGITIVGYWSGKSIPNIDTYLPVIIVAIIGISLIPTLLKPLMKLLRSKVLS